MTTAVDTSVLLDILLDDPQFGRLSERALQEARRSGRLVVCEAVVAELRPALGSSENLKAFLDDLSLEFLPSTQESAEKAGAMYSGYLANKGGAKRVLPDFLVGAHASLMAQALLARDRGYYRDYFREVALIDPAPMKGAR
jgi:hypothetical protein